MRRSAKLAQVWALAGNCTPINTTEDPEAQEQFQRVQDAYAILGDEEKRAAYDESGGAEQFTFVLDGNGKKMQGGREKTGIKVFFRTLN